MERTSLTSVQPPAGLPLPKPSDLENRAFHPFGAARRMQHMTELTPESVAPDPVAQFRAWFEEAIAAGVRQPEAMTLATATPDGLVSARTVLLRGVDERGFRFFTNFESAKGRELGANPRAALGFHWRERERQVRVVGTVRRVADDEAARYWETRPRGHRVSAWASPQSAV